MGLLLYRSSVLNVALRLFTDELGESPTLQDRSSEALRRRLFPHHKEELAFEPRGEVMPLSAATATEEVAQCWRDSDDCASSSDGRRH